MMRREIIILPALTHIREMREKIKREKFHKITGNNANATAIKSRQRTFS
jgi:hypothetical protein